MGDTIKFGGGTWNVVAFSMPGALRFDSEAWVDANVFEPGLSPPGECVPIDHRASHVF